MKLIIVDVPYKYARLKIASYSKWLIYRTNDQIRDMLIKTHPNSTHDFQITGGNIGYIGSYTTVKELMEIELATTTQLGVDGFRIDLVDAQINYNTKPDYPFAGPIGYTMTRRIGWL